MKRVVFLIVLAVVAFPWQASAQTDQANSIQQQILGTWKLVSYVREEIPSGAKSMLWELIHPVISTTAVTGA